MSQFSHASRHLKAAVTGAASLLAVGLGVGTYAAAPAVASASTPPAAQTGAPLIHGWITASASGIRDQSGQVVRLLGVDDGRMNQCSPSVPDDREAATIRNLGFNNVRLAISWAAAEPTAPTRAANGTWVHHWNPRYLAQIDQAVATFRAHGIAVILDMHQVRLGAPFNGSRCQMSLPAWVFSGVHDMPHAVCDFFSNTRAPGSPVAAWQGMSAVWSMLAHRYAANSTVIAADLYNEPYVPSVCPTVQSKYLASFYGTVGSAIRAVNPQLTLIMQDVAYQTWQKRGIQLTHLPALRNEIYSWHFYPSTWSQGYSGLVAHVERAQALHVPLWLGEFDAFGASGNLGQRVDPSWQSDLASMMKYCRVTGVNWNMWEYRGHGESLINLHTGAAKTPLTTSLRLGF